uniref:TonB-like protein n=1 Tax=uncultured organism TaxID=155900 RepID=E3T340_9ZZZZ|nr:TonB-like protein [uncultured organism]
MTITRFHMSVAALIALALHGGIAVWLRLPESVPLPEPPPPPLRVSLLAPVAETTVTTSPAISEPPPPEPILEPTPVLPEPEKKPKTRPVLKPRPVSKPVVKKVTPEPPPIKPRLIETTKKTTPPRPIESSAAPLDVTAAAQYEQLLVAWLEKHKKYPRRAKRLRIEGDGMLRILIDRTGRTQQIVLEQRTGNRLLDRAALEMAQRADPFPPIPENDPRRELEFIVPVAFVLR